MTSLSLGVVNMVLGFTIVGMSMTPTASQTGDTGGIAYFLEQPPESSITYCAKTSAKTRMLLVRLLETPTYLIGRRNPAYGFGISESIERAEDSLFYVNVEIVRDFSDAKSLAGTRTGVYFGQAGSKERVIYPYTPDALSKNHYSVAEVLENGKVKLCGVPISEDDYKEWNEEWMRNAAGRSKSGSKDK